MKRLFCCLMLASVLSVFALAFPAPNHAQSLSPQLVLLDAEDQLVTAITDGDLVRLRLSGASVQDAGQVTFHLDGGEAAVGECQLAAGEDGCVTSAVKSLGWRWNPGGAAGQHVLQARLNGAPLAESGNLSIEARPVVMVHGFSSSWDAWSNYLGQQGYLAADGIRGYAVGDGQVPGVMNTGSLASPEGRTNTIAQNAAILGKYIESVKKATGAQQVDLIAHSMGGLISRYYIDRVMKTRDVAQLIMLGSPMGGTDCANLPASLGFYLPAALEIRPSYVMGIFNEQITHRKGVPFFALAGTPIQEAFGSPCTNVPTDLAVSLESVSDIPLHLSMLPILHPELNTSSEVYTGYVRPLLQKPPIEFADEPDSPPPSGEPGAIQFTRVYTGHVEAGWRQEVTIQIEPDVSVASFALFDSTRSLNVEVRGASGNLINLDPARNGLVVVDDPTSLVYLGYGFQDPKPGAWKVTLWATEKTPATGTDYALTAHFKGGSILRAQVIPFLPQVGQAVQLTASLDRNSKPLPIDSASAVLRLPDGKTQTISLSISGDQAQGSWEPGEPGLYGVDITVRGRGVDGEPVERASFLSVEAQPESGSPRSRLILAAIISGVLLVLGFVLATVAMLLRRGRRARRAGG